MTYTLTCPDEDCGHVFKHDAEPTGFVDGAPCITCPECTEEWDWEYDPDEDTLELVAYDEDDEDELDPDEEEEDDPA